MLGADEALFGALPATDDELPRAPGADETLLIWDERMELHRQGVD